MGMPVWWGERRFGLFVHATVATVPAWAPLGEYAEWYRSHLGEDVADVALHPRPMVEVLAHHRDRWGHIDRYDDFVPLLTFDRFDPEAWAGLARDAGAGYTVLVTKHHDGWTWWDAPNARHRLTDAGPQRNVVAEYAAACERNDIVFGTYYSLLDWGDDRYLADRYVEEVLHPHVLDLVERFGTNILWGDGHWGHDASVWRTKELMQRVREVAPDVVINDRWGASRSDVPLGAPPIVKTFEYDAPDDITDGPWELCRGIGQSFGHNRTERAEHHLTGFDIVALLSEVVSKGGNLLLNVGPAADGTIPELQAAPLRDAGAWIRRHASLLARAVPWSTWGDDDVRYLCADGAVYAIDVAGRGRFPHLDPARHRVLLVEPIVDQRGEAADRASAPHDFVSWRQDDSGLDVSARAALDGSDPIGIPVYRITVDTPPRPVGLFAPTAVRPAALDVLLDQAKPGDIVQLGEGRYTGPAHVPAGVIVRGLGPDRTTIGASGTDRPPGPDDPVVTLGRGACLEHVRVEGTTARTDWFPPAVVVVREPNVRLLGCVVDGHLDIAADDIVIRAVTARGVVALNADRLVLSRCVFAGNRWDVGIDLRAGGGQEIESCELADHLCAIRATSTTGSTIRGNTITARWWGVHLDQTERAQVRGNRIRWTMRAVDVDGGSEALVEGNAVADGDSGCIVAQGAAGCSVNGNHWERCRVGLLEWGATALHQLSNRCTDLHEPGHEHVLGP